MDEKKTLNDVREFENEPSNESDSRLTVPGNPPLEDKWRRIVARRHLRYALSVVAIVLLVSSLIVAAAVLFVFRQPVQVRGPAFAASGVVPATFNVGAPSTFTLTATNQLNRSASAFWFLNFVQVNVTCAWFTITVQVNGVPLALSCSAGGIAFPGGGNSQFVNYTTAAKSYGPLQTIPDQFTITPAVTGTFELTWGLVG